MKQRIMIIGPNGVGKTKFAYEFARRHHGQIVNLDRTYLYRHFRLTTGLQDTMSEVGVIRHLYELLEPEDVAYPAPEFSEIVDKTTSHIVQSGHLAVAEGGSTLYVPHLLELNSKKNIFTHVIGLRFSAGYDVEDKYRRRIDQAFSEGLAEELAQNLLRYKQSYLIKECHFAIPTVEYLAGECCLSEAKNEILRRCLEYKDRQLQLFSQYTDVRWLDAGDIPACYLALEELISVPV